MYLKDNNLTTLAGMVKERFLMGFKGQAKKFGFHCLTIKRPLRNVLFQLAHSFLCWLNPLPLPDMSS